MGDRFSGGVEVDAPTCRYGFNPLSACDVGIAAVSQKRGDELWRDVEKYVGMNALEEVVGQDCLKVVVIIARSLVRVPILRKGFI